MSMYTHTLYITYYIDVRVYMHIYNICNLYYIFSYSVGLYDMPRLLAAEEVHIYIICIRYVYVCTYIYSTYYIYICVYIHIYTIHFILSSSVGLCAMPRLQLRRTCISLSLSLSPSLSPSLSLSIYKYKYI